MDPLFDDYRRCAKLETLIFWGFIVYLIVAVSLAIVSMSGVVS